MRYAARVTVLAVLLSASSPVAADEVPTVGGLVLGEHWYGTAVTKADLEGKVVLFVLWGSCVGCKQATPHLIELAQRLQGQPFHLIATHTHNNVTKSQVLAYVEANGLSAFAPNFTITKDGRHPRVKGNGILVPYSMVFDHAGKLVYEHMSGSYHGGNGWTMIEYVDKALEDAPVIWLGHEPFERHDALARQLAKGKGIGGALKKIEARRASADDEAEKAELERLHAALARYRDDQLAAALALEGTNPSGILPALGRLARDVKGSTLAGPVQEKLAELEASADLKSAIEIEKKFNRAAKSFRKLKEKQRTEAVVARTVKQLEELIEGHESLPISKTVEAFLANLR
jgi:thiol-disulfide isomerase/thioredoxin